MPTTGHEERALPLAWGQEQERKGPRALQARQQNERGNRSTAASCGSVEGVEAITDSNYER